MHHWDKFSSQCFTLHKHLRLKRTSSISICVYKIALKEHTLQYDSGWALMFSACAAFKRLWCTGFEMRFVLLNTFLTGLNPQIWWYIVAWSVCRMIYTHWKTWCTTHTHLTNGFSFSVTCTSNFFCGVGEHPRLVLWKVPLIAGAEVIMSFSVDVFLNVAQELMHWSDCLMVFIPLFNVVITYLSR